MRKTYSKPEAHIVEFGIKETIMDDNLDLGGGLVTSESVEDAPPGM